MNEPDISAIESTVGQWLDPYLRTDWISSGSVRSLTIDEGAVQLSIELGYPAAGLVQEYNAQLKELILRIPNVDAVNIEIAWKIAAHEVQPNVKPIANVKNILAIASGKGGVGKSTVTANLAMALAGEGATVGVLDADIYGPSQPLMFGVKEGTKPNIIEQKYFEPIRAHGVQLMSMGILVTEETPMVWRGPMASGALQQLLGQTVWQDLDYLLIDMPPGTGDIQLTLSQSVPVTGAIIVTTPQDIALSDAKKGIEMFRKVNVPVLGVVENMSMHICSECGHSEHIFGHGGGDRIATEYDTELLGSLPLDRNICQHADEGAPIVMSEPQSKIAASYREIARQFAANLSLRQSNSTIPNIVMLDD